MVAGIQSVFTYSKKILKNGIGVNDGISIFIPCGFVSVARIFKKNIANKETINIGKFHRFEKVAANRHIADTTQVKMLVMLK